ncbi:uncharacterized protein [Triticum aestivum]|uniref:Uncharacterized protein n=2 Tax=Triticum TaxID=4564 RepID=A0A9R0Z125_TRITD|nr:uncharacterized protein LOC123151500 [Triticum aestivum]VAI68329.1 unnamed protein product [Triticum turgidum subsp. durum]
MGNFASRDASSSVKEAQRVSATSCRPKDSRRKHWDSESIQDWLEMAELAGPRVYSCCHCWNHVCLHDDVISKAFHVNNFTKVSLPILAPAVGIKSGQSLIINK